MMNNEGSIGKDATQKLVSIREIRNNIAILDDESLVVVVMVSSMNFELKSYDEQIATIKSFKSFLSLLEFPIQISIQSRKIDINPYLESLEYQLLEKKSPLMKTQISEYINFITEFTKEVDIMQKSFYLVVNYSPARIKSASSSKKNSGFLGNIISIFKKNKKYNFLDNKKFEEYRLQLEQRVNILVSGITRIGLKTDMLSTKELLELYNNIYNPGEK